MQNAQPTPTEKALQASQQRGLAQQMGWFERYLSLWVLACIGLGIFLGAMFPTVFQQLARFKFAEVNLPVALLMWCMLVPMLAKIDFSAMREVWQHRRGLMVTLVINWLVKPFSMALLAWLFIRHWFADYLPADQIDSYVAGLILLAAAPCTAMVFVWSHLCRGDAKFTLTQVAVNDAIMLFAFAPLVAFLLGVSEIRVPWVTLWLSLLLFVVVPLLISQGLRFWHLQAGSPPAALGQAKLNTLLARLQPLALLALLAMLVLLFAYQGKQLLAQPEVMLLLAVPILIQVYFNALLAYWLNRQCGVAHAAAGPSALIGASNFFELAVATAIALFGLESGAALATVVGVLIEVPVMLSVVVIVNASRRWYGATE